MILKDEKILIINPFGIGDCLFTTPAIRAIKDTYPDVLIAYWCNVRVREIFQNNPNIYKIFSLSRGDLKKIYCKSWFEGTKSFFGLLSSIKKEKFDIVLDFSLDHRYSLYAKILGIKKRIGFNYKRRGRFLTEKIDIKGYSQKHIVSYYMDLLKVIGIKPEVRPLELFTPDADKIRAKNLIEQFGVSQNDLLVAIAPGAGASWGLDAKFKHWPALNFSKLIEKIVTQLGAKVILLGEPLERPIADFIKSSTKSSFIDLVGKTELTQLIALISNCQILVTNDGGPMHIAVAVGIKSVSIFGPVDEIVYGPYPESSKHIVIKNNIQCRPCYREFKLPVCPINKQCLNSITVDEVFDATRRLI